MKGKGNHVFVFFGFPFHFIETKEQMNKGNAENDRVIQS